MMVKGIVIIVIVSLILIVLVLYSCLRVESHCKTKEEDEYEAKCQLLDVSKEKEAKSISK